MWKAVDGSVQRISPGPRLRLALCSATAVGTHAAGVALGGWLLWITAGTNVANGSTLGQVLFTVTVILGVAVHTCTARLTVSSSTAHLVRGVAQSGIAAVLLIAWWVTNCYYTGWLALLSVIALLVDSVLRLLVVVVVPARDGRGGTPRVDRGASATAGIGVAAAIGGLFATASVHTWDGIFLNNLVLLLVTGSLIGYIGSPLITRLIEMREATG